MDELQAIRRVHLAVHGVEEPPATNTKWPFLNVPDPALQGMIQDLSERDPFKQGQPSAGDNAHRNQPPSHEEREKSEMHKRWLSHENDCYNDAMLVGQEPGKRYTSLEEARNAGIFMKSQGSDTSPSVSQEQSKGNNLAQTDTTGRGGPLNVKAALDAAASNINQGVKRLGSGLLKVNPPGNGLKVNPGFPMLNPGFVAAQ
ncbi:MAG: hypothetical protein M1816_001846 [Peltula sp. TS41687]|nr:MAG: hypothetical protein M1816_001846 [Peltula sp. TS41687]